MDTLSVVLSEIVLIQMIVLTALTRKTDVGNILFTILCIIVLLHNFFGVIKDEYLYTLTIVIPFIIFFFCKLLALIYKKLTGDTEDYNKFIQWFG